MDFLSNCPKCGSEIRVIGGECPYCSVINPSKENNKKAYKIWGIIITALIFGILLLSFLEDIL